MWVECSGTNHYLFTHHQRSPPRYLFLRPGTRYSAEDDLDTPRLPLTPQVIHTKPSTSARPGATRNLTGHRRRREDLRATFPCFLTRHLPRAVGYRQDERPQPCCARADGDGGSDISGALGAAKFRDGGRRGQPRPEPYVGRPQRFSMGGKPCSPPRPR